MKLHDKYFTFLRYPMEVDVPMHIKNGKKAEATWTTSYTTYRRGGHISAEMFSAAAFTDMDTEDQVNSLLTNPEFYHFMEDSFGPNHWAVWAEDGYLKQNKSENECKQRVVIVLGGKGAQAALLPWLHKESKQERFYKAFRFDGLQYELIDVQGLYEGCHLWPKMIGRCNTCGLMQRQTCLRTLMLEISGTPLKAPEALPLIVREDEDGTYLRTNGKGWQVQEHSEELRENSPEVFGEHHRIPQTLCHGSVDFFEAGHHNYDSFTPCGADINDLREEMSERSKKAAATRKFRKETCNNCPFYYECVDNKNRYDTSWRSEPRCQGGWNDIKKVVARLSAQKTCHNKTLEWWEWLRRQAETPIYITANWCRTGRHTTRTYYLSPTTDRNNLRLTPRMAYLPGFTFFSYAEIRKHAKREGWVIEGLIDPKTIDLSLMHRRTRRLLVALYHGFNFENYVRVVEYAGMYNCTRRSPYDGFFTFWLEDTHKPVDSLSKVYFDFHRFATAGGRRQELGTLSSTFRSVKELLGWNLRRFL